MKKLIQHGLKFCGSMALQSVHLQKSVRLQKSQPQKGGSLKRLSRQASQYPKALPHMLLTATLASSTLLLSGLTHAAETTLPVDLAGVHATKYEIAVLQVISEMCPTMLASNQHSHFYKTYNNKLQELLPTISDPKAAIRYLSTQQDYKMILSSARSRTMEYSYNDNLALCTDLASESEEAP